MAWSTSPKRFNFSILNHFNETTYKPAKHTTDIYEFLEWFKPTLTSELTSTLTIHQSIKALINVNIRYMLRGFNSEKSTEKLQSKFFPLLSIDAIPSVIEDLIKDTIWRDDWYRENYQYRTKKINSISIKTTKYLPNEKLSKDSDSKSDTDSDGDTDSEVSDDEEDEEGDGALNSEGEGTTNKDGTTNSLVQATTNALSETHINGGADEEGHGSLAEAVYNVEETYN